MAECRYCKNVEQIILPIQITDTTEFVCNICLIKRLDTIVV